MDIRNRSGVFKAIVQVVMIVCVLSVWQVAAGRWIDPFWVSQPSQIWYTLVEWVRSGDLTFHLRITLVETGLGFLLGSLAGIILGFVLGLNSFVAEVLEPFLAALYTLPRMALGPLFVLWFGIDIATKVAFSALIVFFLVFYATFDAVRDVEPKLVDVLRVMGASRTELLVKVTLPSALTGVFSGLRIAVPYALVGAVVGEIVASNKGLGYVLNNAALNLDTPAVFAAIMVMVTMVLALYAAVDSLQRRLLRWKLPR